MSNPQDSAERRLQALSSLADGELSEREVSEACALWRQDAQARRHWHAYHLIGDVLRSEDLAVQPSHDQAFLNALRGRLAAEPVPLAPAQVGAAAGTAPPAALPEAAIVRSPRHRSRRWWMAPTAVAAGFVAVAGVMVVTQSAAPVAQPEAGVAAAPALPLGDAAAGATLVRDAQLDRYLSAHRSLAHGAAPARGAEHRVHIVFEGR